MVMEYTAFMGWIIKQIKCNKMIKGLRYLADKLEQFKFWLIAKWNNFLKALMI